MALADPDNRSGQTDGLSLAALVKVVAYKQFILLVRYPVNTVSKLVSLFGFFVVIFFGGRALAGPALTDSLDGIIVGFFLFTLALVSYGGLSRNVIKEAQWGTLERLFMSPHGFGVVMWVKTIVNVFLSFLWASALLLLMMLLTGRWLTIDPLTVVPLLVLTLMPIVGIGFVLGGLALLYKRIENLFEIIQFGLIGLIAAPVDRVAWLKFLPVAHGSYLTRIAVSNDVRLWQFHHVELGTLFITSLVYLLSGYYVFHRATIRARREGLLGHY